jgi:hypothetical protein
VTLTLNCIDQGVCGYKSQRVCVCLCASQCVTGVKACLERFQSKALRMMVDVPWYVSNTVIRRDLQTPTVKEEIQL